MEVWNELTFKVKTEDTDRAASICTTVADDGLYIEDYSQLESEVNEIAHIDLIDEDLIAKDRGSSLIHMYIKDNVKLSESASFLSDMLKNEGIPFSMSTVGVNEEDWANGWKKYYHVMHIGKKFVICPSWEEYTPAQDEVMMELDPGMAFGTGTHDTTRLCLELLEDVVTPDTRILDVGTGSGILSVGGALLGAPLALGVDIDAVAVKTAIENAKRNHVENVTNFICGDLTEKVSGQFEIVTANIVADVIIRLLGTIKNFLLPGGAFITSGIIDTRADEVIKACEEAGFTLIKRIEHGGWVALLMR